MQVSGVNERTTESRQLRQWQWQCQWLNTRQMGCGRFDAREHAGHAPICVGGGARREPKCTYFLSFVFVTCLRRRTEQQYKQVKEEEPAGDAAHYKDIWFTDRIHVHVQDFGIFGIC